MIPERDRLADTLILAVLLHSPEGISALEDLIALLKMIPKSHTRRYFGR